MATAAASTATAAVVSLSSIHCMHNNDPIRPQQQQQTRVALFSSLQPHDNIIISSYKAGINESVLSNWVLRKWRILRISAAVAQDEASLEETDADEFVEKEGGTNNTKLYFGNLPYLCDSAQLAGIIQEYANPELIEVLYDRQTGRSRGFAFVTMSCVEVCNTVIQNLEGRDFGGRTMRVNFADQPKPKQPLYPETEYKLFVGNLSWSATSESLIQLFQEHGCVVGARVLYDGETGRSRGYGFVSYATQAEMETALETLNGVESEGRAIRVSLAEGKKQCEVQRS